MSPESPEALSLRIKTFFFARNEKALEICYEKFGKLFYRIAFNITGNHETSEEIVNDTYVKMWNSIPPANPDSVSSYGARIVHNLALNRVRDDAAKGRPQILCELDEMAPDSFNAEMQPEELGRLISAFLEKLKEKDRLIFIHRYFEENTSAAISERFGISPSGVRSSLERSREKLRAFLESNGYQV